MERVVLHCDANAFYASVECLYTPSIRHSPVAVCGSVEERHGIVLTKNQIAKQFGVQTGEAIWQARQKCPDLICVPPDYPLYIRFSRRMRRLYEEYSDRVESFGLDEAWIDLSNPGLTIRDGERIAHEIRLRVKRELGITVSVGVSFNKIFAKLGSDMKKPDAVTTLPRDDWKGRIWPLPVSELLYVGPATTRKLMSRNILTIGDLAKTPPELLHDWFGKNGIVLWRFANGEDNSRVMQNDYEAPIKSVGHGITCSCDLRDNESVWRVMLELSQDIGHRLRVYGLAARGVRLAVRSNDLSGSQYQTQLSYPSQSPMEIAQAARTLFLTRYSWNMPVRSLTVTGINLVPSDQPTQLDMFGDEQRRMRRQKLEDCVDEIRNRFGKRAIFSAALMGELNMPDDGRHEVTMPGMMYS